MSAKSGDLATQVAKYMARAVREGDCLVGRMKGYGSIRYDGGKTMRAHRASYLVHNGPIPPGMVVRHTCDRVGCIEPTHLLVGTQADNERDKIERGRHVFGIRSYGATLTAEQVREAVQDYLTGTESQPEVARRWGVTQSALGRWVRAEMRYDAGLPRVFIGKGRRPESALKPCGTRAGYFRHRSRDEAICEDCREANRTYMYAYKSARKDGAA